MASGIGGLAAPVLQEPRMSTQWRMQALIGGGAYGVLFGGYGGVLFGMGMAEEVVGTHVTSALVVATAYGAPAILFGVGAALLTSWLCNRLPLARRKRIGAVCFSASAFLASLTLSVVVDVKGPGIYRMMAFWVPFPAAVYGLLAPEYVVEDEAWTGWLDRISVGAMGALVSGAISGVVFLISWLPLGIAAGTLDDPVKLVAFLFYIILFGVLASLPAMPFGIGAAALTSWLCADSTHTAADHSGPKQQQAAGQSRKDKNRDPSEAPSS